MISVSIFRRMMRDRTRGFAAWSLAMILQTAFLAAMFPTVRGQDEFNDIVDRLPDNFQSLFGLDTSLSLASALGYLDSRLFSTLLPVLLLIFAIGIGSRMIAGAEDDGLLELPVAHPVTRQAFAGGRLAAMAVLVFGLTTVSILSVLAIGPTVDLLDGVPLGNFAAVGLTVYLLAMTHGTIAFLVGAAGARRATALGTSAALAVAGWLAEGGGDSGVANAIRWATPWHWYVDARALVDGLSWQAVVLPMVTSTIAIAAGVVAFDRRDLR